MGSAGAAAGAAVGAAMIAGVPFAGTAAGADAGFADIEGPQANAIARARTSVADIDTSLRLGAGPREGGVPHAQPKSLPGVGIGRTLRLRRGARAPGARPLLEQSALDRGQ